MKYLTIALGILAIALVVTGITLMILFVDIGVTTTIIECDANTERIIYKGVELVCNDIADIAGGGS